ncbi:BTB/POZ and TAZ domain-containing protein 1 [Apostasia shenzhenica]|uniref:BTB/POZ and TAZ domain-containing protein 1 n=1 Tax=Apostasia shenzhenica TaxID=1088818 RepID=A0A2I0BE73_9ASPA|nr:BTB/POZ and TAZ domain-containing protein 1 [Apostasia shenzhenica]
MKLPAGTRGFRHLDAATADAYIVTSGGRSIPAHSCILASASPVLERLLERGRPGSSGTPIQILGAPCDAVVDFVDFLYSGADALPEVEEAAARHGVQLLVLAHAYRVGWLKRRFEEVMGRRVRPEDSVDVMKVAKLCDSPELFQRCLAVAEKDFAVFQRTEGWRFVQSHDRQLELEVLRFLHDAEQRKRRWRREKADQEIFAQLSEAMDCLQHICTEGCTEVGPHGVEPSRSRGPCISISFRTCAALQLLIRHFATCGKKLSRGGFGGSGCTHCRRMWQLFRLHSSLCERDDGCKVPLCKQFRLRPGGRHGKGKEDDATWRLLVRKVAAARVMSSLAARKTPEELGRAWERYRRTK